MIVYGCTGCTRYAERLARPVITITRKTSVT